jgi:hypothetical protein
VPAAFAQSTENLIVTFAQRTSQAVLLSPWLTVAIALMLAVTAFVVLRRRAVRGGRLFGWLRALSIGATLAVATVERAIPKRRQLSLPP